MITFSPSDLVSIKNFRDMYFSDIRLAQDVMLEWFISNAECYEILDRSEIEGYFIKSDSDTLLEFYVTDHLLPRKEEVFRNILGQFSIQKAFCKSFDSVCLTCCQIYCHSVSIFGTLFRDHTPEITVELDKDLQIRIAREVDIPKLLKVKSGLFESPEELNYVVSNRMLHLFEQGKELIGAGYLIRILKDKNYYDIGAWTNPVYREKGFGQQIISYLKLHCLEHGYDPVCACMADNIECRRIMEKNGFVSKYSMFLYDF